MRRLGSPLSPNMFCKMDVAGALGWPTGGGEMRMRTVRLIAIPIAHKTLMFFVINFLVFLQNKDYQKQ